MNKYIERDFDSVEHIFPEALKLALYEGEIFELPIAWWITSMRYDNKLFDEAGINYPQDDWTIDQMLSMAEKLRIYSLRNHSEEDRVAGLNCNGGYPEDFLRFMIISQGGTIYKEEGRKIVPTISTDQITIETLSRIIDLVRDEVLALEDFGTPAAIYSTDVHGDSYYLPIIRVPSGRKTRLGSANFFGAMIRKESKNKELAWELVKFMASDEFSRTLIDWSLYSKPDRSFLGLYSMKDGTGTAHNFFPTSQNILKEELCPEAEAELYEIINEAKLSKMLNMYEHAILSRVEKAIEKVAANDASLEEALREAEENAMKWLKNRGLN